MLQNVRIWFRKTGTAKYISHLDLTRCMARALKLSGLPVWYTQGFNPRIYMTFAMPLSLGFSGEQECMDIRLIQEADFEQAVVKLNSCLPEDIRILKMAIPLHKFDAISLAAYQLKLEWEEPQILEAAFDRLLKRDSVIVLKHGKKGDKSFDIKPFFISTIKASVPGALLIDVTMPCSTEGSVNPALLLEALKQYEGFEPYSTITRKSLMTKDFSDIQ